MKSISILFFVLCSSFSFAQNWSLFPIDNTLNYQRVGSKYITDNLIVSKQIIGTDTSYNFSIAILPCDTCTNMQGKYYTYQSCFLAQKYKLDSNLNPVLYFKNGNAILYLNKEVGFNWNYRGSITATIISKDERILFSELDSVQTILFSNGDTIRISKNNGVVLFKHPALGYLKLIGNETQKKGKQLFKFKNYNILGVNDYFSYTENSFDGSSGFPCNRTKIIVYKIKKIDTINFDLKYTCDSKIRSFGYYDCTNFNSSFNETSYETNKVVSAGTILETSSLLNLIRFNGTANSGMRYNVSGVQIFNEDTIISNSGVDNRHTNSKKYLKMITPELFKVDSADGLYFWYSKPIAWLNSSEWNFEQGFSKGVGSYSKNGVLFGLNDTNIYSGIYQQKIIVKALYPQPNDGEFNIALENVSINEGIIMSVFDINGRVILEKEFNNLNFIKVVEKSIQDGIYIVKLKSGEFETYQKLIINRSFSQ